MKNLNAINIELLRREGFIKVGLVIILIPLLPLLFFRSIGPSIAITALSCSFLFNLRTTELSDPLIVLSLPISRFQNKLYMVFMDMFSILFSVVLNIIIVFAITPFISISVEPYHILSLYFDVVFIILILRNILTYLLPLNARCYTIKFTLGLPLAYTLSYFIDFIVKNNTLPKTVLYVPIALFTLYLLTYLLRMEVN